MSEVRKPARLTGEEVALVLRRAAEIDAQLEPLPDVDRYDAAAVEAAAGEVGLSPAAVRQALAELQVASAQAESRLARPGSVPGHILAEQRLVDAPPARVLATAERLLRAQLFETRRRRDDQMLFRPRTDLSATLRRRLNLGPGYWLDGVSCVTVVVTPVDTGTLLRVEAELSMTRTNVVAGSAAAGTGIALAVGFAGALFHEPLFAVSALPLGAAVAASGVRAGGRRWRQRRDDIAEALAALVDRI